MLFKQFYSELGKLLYAIADVDGMISKKEKSTILDLVKKELVPNEINKDEFGTDAAYYTEIEFEFLEDTIPEPQAAFESFVNFIENHKTAINKRMIEATRKVALHLADVHYSTSKKENKLLTELNKKLDNLMQEK